jgi:iron(III) transport system ATP-binding protein
VTAALALEAVSVTLGGQPILRRVSLSLAPGEVVALLGPSGSGKSTLLRVVVGFEKPSAGRVTILGRVVTEGGSLVVSPEARQLSMVFQDLALWPHLDIRGHLAFVLQSRRVPAKEHPPRIDALLRRLGLEDKARRRPGQLSGGERQRVAIARALVTDPAALLLDEPLANVDIALKHEMLDLFADLLRERATPALYVTHDPREAARLADRVLILEEGALVQEGTLSALRSTPATPFVRRLVDSLDR